MPDRCAAALAARAGHPGRRAGFVHEHQLRPTELGLPFGPGLAARGDVLARLLAGRARSFVERDAAATDDIADRADRECLAALHDQPLAPRGRRDIRRLPDGAKQQVGLRPRSVPSAGRLRAASRPSGRCAETRPSGAPRSRCRHRTDLQRQGAILPTQTAQITRLRSAPEKS
jgi:hypothetical protein